MLRVEIIRKENPQAWHEVGTVYQVIEYAYLATREGATNRCSCTDCLRFRKNRKLFPLYEIHIPEEDRGKLLFQEYCRILPTPGL